MTGEAFPPARVATSVELAFFLRVVVALVFAPLWGVGVRGLTTAGLAPEWKGQEREVGRIPSSRCSPPGGGERDPWAGSERGLAGSDLCGGDGSTSTF